MAQVTVDESQGFQVPYEVREAKYGRGVFALTDIPAGTLIWKRGATNVRYYHTWSDVEQRLQELPDEASKRFFASHVYCDPMMIEILDDGGIWNHSETPNTGGGEVPFHSYALRDIHAGEELLDDYGCYEYPDTYMRLQELWGENQDFIHKKPVGFSIDYEVKDTGGKGLGLFTKEFIPKGKTVWRCKSWKNMLMFDGEAALREYLNTFESHERRREAITHSYSMHEDVVMVLTDDGKYMNHSDTPNTFSTDVAVDRDCSVASRDIEVGEELTCDYGHFNFPEWYVQLHTEFNVPLDYFTRQPRA